MATPPPAPERGSTFRQGDLLWCKCKGYCDWPATALEDECQGTVLLQFFNWQPGRLRARVEDCALYHEHTWEERTVANDCHLQDFPDSMMRDLRGALLQVDAVAAVRYRQAQAEQKEQAEHQAQVVAECLAQLEQTKPVTYTLYHEVKAAAWLKQEKPAYTFTKWTNVVHFELRVQPVGTELQVTLLSDPPVLQQQAELTLAWAQGTDTFSACRTRSVEGQESLQWRSFATLNTQEPITQLTATLKHTVAYQG